MYPLLRSSSFFFFFLAIVFSSWELSTPFRIIKDEAKFRACSQQFNCGNITNITYPFWGGNRTQDCGPPQFELECRDGTRTEIEIESRKFTIFEIRQREKTLTVVCKDIMDDGCPDRIPSIRVGDSDSHFECASSNANLTYFYNCRDGMIPSKIPPELRCDRNPEPVYKGFFEGKPHQRDPSCKSSIKVPIRGKHPWDSNSPMGKEAVKRGFDLRYRDVDVGTDCQECIDSAGQCGYNRTSEEFVCFSCPSSGSNERGLKLGLGIGLPVIFLVILFLLWHYKQKCSAPKFLSRSISDPYMNLDPEGGSVYYGVHVFSYKDLEEATNNFDGEKELGDGGFGTVYHGKLKDGREVAVKRLYEHNYKRVEQFKNEIEILARLRHKNLVSLYGCTSRHCRELLLVYEYLPNGTVADHLHGNRAQTSPLSWPVRMSVAIETAAALAYLHASDIVHRDVKTNNILLDNNFCVKVADFGLSRLFPNDVTHVSTAPQGTPGYVDPEYHQCYQLTSKSDVYSFGVVLVELISSMPAVDITRHRHEINLSNLAISKIQKHAYNELVDLRLGFDSDSETKRMTISVAELAFQCLQQDKEMRPTMDEVLEELKSIESGNNESQNQVKKGFDGVPNSVQPPPSPDCDEIGLLKRVKEQPPSPNTVTENWPSNRSSTPNISG